MFLKEIKILLMFILKLLSTSCPDHNFTLFLFGEHPLIIWLCEYGSSVAIRAWLFIRLSIMQASEKMLLPHKHSCTVRTRLPTKMPVSGKIVQHWALRCSPKKAGLWPTVHGSKEFKVFVQEHKLKKIQKHSSKKDDKNYKIGSRVSCQALRENEVFAPALSLAWPLGPILQVKRPGKGRIQARPLVVLKKWCGSSMHTWR